MTIESITSGAFSPFPASGVAAAGAPTTGNQPAAGAQAAGRLPEQATLDAIRQALATLTAGDASQSSDGTDGTDTTDPLAAILQTTQQDQGADPTASPGSLGLDMMA